MHCFYAIYAKTSLPGIDFSSGPEQLSEWKLYR